MPIYSKEKGKTGNQSRTEEDKKRLLAELNRHSIDVDKYKKKSTYDRGTVNTEVKTFPKFFTPFGPSDDDDNDDDDEEPKDLRQLVHDRRQDFQLRPEPKLRPKNRSLRPKDFTVVMFLVIVEQFNKY